MWKKSSKEQTKTVKTDDAPKAKTTRVGSVCALITRILWIIILGLFNVCIWAYVSYRIHVIYDEVVYAGRAQQQRVLERLHRSKKPVVLDAIAVVDGEAIPMSDVEEMVNDMPQLAELPFEEIYPNLVEMLINNRVIMHGAQKAGVLDRPEIKKQLRLMTEQIVGQTYLDELLRARITEEELKEVYERELKNFRREEEIHARHILLKTEKEAQDVLVQLKAGANFAELADKKSLDENTQGGDLGYFTKAMMIPEFGDAVFDMKKGQLSAPIKTAFGWHVVLVEDKRLANPPSFEDLREDILRAAMETKLPMVLDEERGKLNVQILRPTLDSAP